MSPEQEQTITQYIQECIRKGIHVGRYRLMKRFGLAEHRARAMLNKVKHEMRSRRTQQQTSVTESSQADVSIQQPTMSMDNNICRLASCVEQIKTPEELCAFFKLDMRIWSVQRQTIKAYQMGFTDTNSNPGKINLYSIALTLEKNKAVDETLKIIETEKEDLKKTFKPLFNISKDYSNNDGDKVLVLSLPDVHLGNYSFMEATSFENGTEIMVELYKQTLSKLIGSLTDKEKASLSKIWYIVGNDIFHTDYNQPYTTSRNHLLSEELPWYKTFKIGRELIVSSIVSLENDLCPVHVSVVPGNHDKQRSFYLGDSLECWFQDHKNVTVDNSPHPRKYISFGNVLLGATHGKDEKIQDLPLIMATETLEFSQKKYREFYLGHIHRKKEIAVTTVDEMNSIRIRYLSSLCSPDDWHTSKGYRSLRSAEAFLWDYSEGLEKILVQNV